MSTVLKTTVKEVTEVAYVKCDNCKVHRSEETKKSWVEFCVQSGDLRDFESLDYDYYDVCCVDCFKQFVKMHLDSGDILTIADLPREFVQELCK